MEVQFFITCMLIGLMSSFMDVLFTRYDTSIFYKLSFKYQRLFNPLFWDPRKSYIEKDVLMEWLIKHHITSPTAQFLSHSTLVMFTDAWHLFKFFMCLLIASLCSTNILSLIAYYLIITGTFELFYTVILDGYVKK